MNNLKKRRTSVLIGLALMGLSVHAYAADVTATTDAPTVAHLLKQMAHLKVMSLM